MMTLVKKVNVPAAIAVVALAAVIVTGATRMQFEWRSAEPAGGTTAAADSAPGPSQAAAPALPDESRFEQVAETDTLRLSMDPATGHFRVEDKRNGNVYRSYPDPQYWAQEKMSTTWKQHLASPLMLEYVDFSLPQLNPKDTSFAPGVDQIEDLAKIPGGFQLTYRLPGTGFTVPVQVTIQDDYVETKIIRAGMKEEKLGLVWVRLYPFFGAEHTDGQDGYLFVPDGAGALIRFKENRLNVSKSYDESVYGRDMTFPGLGNNREPVVMPVFGMKSGSKGFLAVLQDGEEYANVVASPAGVFSDYNWIAAQMNFRSSFLQFARRNDPVEYGFLAYNEDEWFGSDRVVRYYMLDSGKSDYVGMAGRYRQYLMEEKGLRPIETGGRKMPLYLTIIGGDEEKGTLSDRYIQGTTTSEAKRMVEALHDSGIENMSITYTGWQEGGYSALGRTFPVDSRLGGYDGMKQFVDFAHSLGFPVYLDTQYALNNTGAGGFDAKYDSVVNLAGQNTQLMLASGDNVSAVSDKYAEEAVARDLDRFKELGVDGLVMNGIGKDLYSDYNTKYGSPRDAARDVQERILQAVKEKLGGVQGISPNFYALPYEDHIQNMAADFSYDLFSDEAVPFAQIATHGLIRYSFEYSNNRQEDVNGFLRDIEYGAVPSYAFSQAETENFVNAYSLRFYSTHYPDWVTVAAREYKRFEEALGDVQDQFIVGHRTLAEGVKETTYAGGKRVIVNYNTGPYRSGDTEVPAQDFIVIQGGSAR